MSAEAGFQEYFPGGQAGVSGENKGIVLHFRLHLRLTCLAELTATCSPRKTPVWSQDHPGLNWKSPSSGKSLHLGGPQFLHSEDGNITAHVGLLWGLNQLMHVAYGHMAVSPVGD